MKAIDHRPNSQHQKQIDWPAVRRVLIVRLRSIGDTVLSTPSLIALKRFRPDAEIDILLEDWVAPLLNGFNAVDNVLTVDKSSSSRLQTAWQIRHRRYDVVFNLHGGTTGTFFTFVSGAKHRVGYAEYQYSFLYNHLLSSAADYWHEHVTHSAEQQLALLGFVGVPVQDRPKSRLAVTDEAMRSMEHKIDASGPFALFHPAAAFATKQWATENFARTAEYLYEKGIHTIAVAAKSESNVLERLQDESRIRITTSDDLSLPEITALASKAILFVGNDSGIAHIAAAVGTPAVVVFGSSNVNHWRPWTDAANELVYEKLPCQPCAGYICKEFGEPKCILSVEPESICEAIERVLTKVKKAGPGSPPL
ncbi:MAG: glycosyltransferase family 9 protein [Saprospiraceae bacterium]|nr:glycosyltransferase family 9 protein [Pyrinomonadaceae bacterium]